MTRLATQYGRYGYRRITELLRREGWKVNHKRIERLWRREGLKVPQKQPKRRRLWLNDGSCVRLTVAGVPDQTAFVLRTFPSPGAHSLMVRHQKTTAPFVAVHEAYNDTPTATGIRLLSGSSITHADRGRRRRSTNPAPARMDGGWPVALAWSSSMTEIGCAASC